MAQQHASEEKKNRPPQPEQMEDEFAPHAREAGDLASTLASLRDQVGNRAVQHLLAHTGAAGQGLVTRQDAGPQTADAGAQASDAGTQRRARTKADARTRVPAHVQPRDCFIWFVNNRAGWDTLPGTGCAHWVAHQIGHSSGLTCDDGFSVRVTDVIAGRQRVAFQDVQVGDLWENPGNASHIGIVRTIDRDPKTNAVIAVHVENDSSRQGGVVTSRFTKGDFYR
jgi:hypothetical protein